MKKNILLLISTSWLCNMHSQNWVNMIDSMPLSQAYFNTGVVDTTSNTLYLGGFFNKVNNMQTKSIIRYNGIKFDTLGAGLDKFNANIVTQCDVRAMIMFQSKLYVGGYFAQTGTYYCKGLGRWNGASWDTVNFKPNGAIKFMQIYNNELYVAGTFDSIGGIKSNNFAKFDGLNWYNIGYPYNTCVTAMEIYKGKIYMAGEVSVGSSCANLAVYDGTSWQPWVGVLGSTVKSIEGLKVIDTMLYVYGRFNGIAGVIGNGLVAYNNSKWFGFGTGISPLSYAYIQDVNKINGELYVSGLYETMNDVVNSSSLMNFAMNITKFSGNKWCTFLEPTNNPVTFTIKYNNELYIAGAFNQVGNNIPVCPLLKWIGANSTISCGQTVNVGLSEFMINQSISTYPNPTNSILNISDEQNQLQNSIINITNYLGQTVLTLPFSNQIDISNLSNGIYTIKINSITSKFIKTN